MAFFFWASSLQAAPVTDPRELAPEQRAAVERLANEGATLFQQGDFASALKKFELAEEIVRIPTITLERGRSLERLGRWVDASTAYEAAATAEVRPTASFQHGIARQDAAKALADIAPKIPKLKVSVKNAAAAEIFVDGRSMGPPKTDPLLVDPGKHVIEARGAAGAHATKTVDLATGANETVELELVSLSDQNSKPSSGPSLFSILGWTAVGTGGALLVVSLGTGVSAIMAESDLAARCPASRCTDEAWSDVDRYDALRWTAGVSLFAGVIIAGGGVALVLLDPESGEAPAKKQGVHRAHHRAWLRRHSRELPVKRALLIIALFVVPACFLPGFEKVEGTGGSGGAEGGAPPVCETVTYVETTDGQTAANDPEDFFNALRVVEFGETALTTRPGFDIDGVCTCCIDCEQIATCNPPPGAQGEECDSVDGLPNQGRDNNIAKFLAGPDSASLGLSSTALRSALEAGTWSLLVRVSEWNGLADDGQVTVAIYTTPGAAAEPAWDGNDVFQVRSDSVVVASLDIDQPLVSNEDAYVADGRLVAVFGTQRPLVLHLDHAFTVELSYAVLQAELSEEGTGYALTDGVIGGIWDMRAVFKALADARLGDMPRICTNSPSYENVKEALCVVRDSLDDPEPVTCGGISFGMSFTGARIVKPTVVEELVDLSIPCEPGTDPTNDICE